MRKNDLVDLRKDVARVLDAIETIERMDIYWESHEGEIPPNLREVGRLRMRLHELSQTIVRAKRLSPKDISRPGDRRR